MEMLEPASKVPLEPQIGDRITDYVVHECKLGQQFCDRNMLVHFKLKRATEGRDLSSFRESVFDASETVAGHLECLRLAAGRRHRAIEAGGARAGAKAGAPGGDAPK